MLTGRPKSQFSSNEGLISNEKLSFKDLEEGLGVTWWQWNQALLAIAETDSGKKTKATRGVAMNMDKETVEKFVDFVLGLTTFRMLHMEPGQ